MGTLNLGGAAFAFDSSGNWTSAPTGSIIQIQTNSNILTETSTTLVSTFVPSAIQVTITPRFASSKILITWTAWCDSSATANHVAWSLHRNGTNLETTGAAFGMGNYYNNGGAIEGHSVGNFIDLPNSTAPLTYNVYLLSFTGSQVRIGNTTRASYINAFEIAQ